MAIIGNIVWLIFGGFPAALAYFIGGAVLCLTIVGIPLGLAAFNLGAAVLWPFGKQVVQKPSGSGILAIIFNVIWVLTLGWQLVLVHLVSALLLGITIIGIPFAIQHLKLIQVALQTFTYKLE